MDAFVSGRQSFGASDFASGSVVKGLRKVLLSYSGYRLKIFTKHLILLLDLSAKALDLNVGRKRLRTKPSDRRRKRPVGCNSREQIIRTVRLPSGAAVR